MNSKKNINKSNVTLDKLDKSPICLSYKLKRLIDILASSIMILITSPVLLIFAVAIKMTSPGPIFFLKQRVGMNKEIFNIINFRTKTVSDKLLFHRPNEDPAVIQLNQSSKDVHPAFFDNTGETTILGKQIYETRTNELPQLFNVLKGDMSIIGPSPARLQEVGYFNEWHEDRFKFRPGIIGLWQISLLTDSPLKEKIQYDIKYINNWSLWLDFKIILQTVLLVLKVQNK